MNGIWVIITCKAHATVRPTGYLHALPKSIQNKLLNYDV